MVNNKYANLYLLWRQYRLRNLVAYRRQLAANIRMLKLHSNDHVLDVGCAFGFDITEMSAMGFDCEGIEITKEFADIARAVNRHFSGRVRVVTGDACDLPYPADCFDAVMSTEMFSHVADSDRAMSEQIRVLKPGGRLLIRDGNILCPVQLYDLLIAWTIRTHGKYGGIKWLKSRKNVISNYDNRGFAGKAEDIRSIHWWKRYLAGQKEMEVEVATTNWAYRHSVLVPSILAPFAGNIVIVARKV
jgi:ubiquinone/menaquinone biosynthesis C-methylase UbiE